jgi:hypothetical protein
MTAEIPQSELDRLRAIIDKIAAELKKSSADILRQGMVFAVTTAAKETAPSKQKLPSRLADKYRYRPIVKPKIPIWKSRETGEVHEGDRPTQGKWKKVTKAFQAWSKSSNGWKYLPYNGFASGKYSKDARIGKIPYAGAAKACWLKAFNRLPGSKDQYSDSSTGKAQPRVWETQSGTDHAINVENTIRYIGITSPNAASRAISSAANRMIGTYKKKISDLEKYRA